MSILRIQHLLRTDGLQVPHPLPKYINSVYYSGISISTFIAELGTGQGDIPSPSLRAALLYILLRALVYFDLIDSHTAAIVKVVIKSVFVDDIESKTAIPMAMHHKAGITVVVAVIFAIKFSEKQFRREEIILRRW